MGGEGTASSSLFICIISFNEHLRRSSLQYDPTIEESYQTTIDIEGKAMQVEILDTAGQDAYTPLRETFMHTGDGFLLVYSIVDDQTLEELREIREQILRVHPDRKVLYTGYCLVVSTSQRLIPFPSRSRL